MELTPRPKLLKFFTIHFLLMLLGTGVYNMLADRAPTLNQLFIPGLLAFYATSIHAGSWYEGAADALKDMMYFLEEEDKKLDAHLERIKKVVEKKGLQSNIDNIVEALKEEDNGGKN